MSLETSNILEIPEETFSEIYLKYKKYKEIVAKFGLSDEVDGIISPRKRSDRKNSLQQLQDACEKYEIENNDLKKRLEDTEKSLESTQSHLIFERNKISNLKNFRQQSVDMIRDLEAELEESKKKVTQTPRNEKIKERRQKAASRPVLTIFTECVKKVEPQKVTDSSKKSIELLEGRLSVEKKQRSELENLLRANEQSKAKFVEKIKEAELEKKNLVQEFRYYKQKNEKKLQEFTGKIESLQRENQELKRKLNLSEKESESDTLSINNEDAKYELGEVDELAELDEKNSPKFNENKSHNFSLTNGRLLFLCNEQNTAPADLLKKIRTLECRLQKSEQKCQKFREQQEKHLKSSQSLNKILLENKEKLNFFKSQLSLASLVHEKEKLNLEIQKKREMLTEFTIKQPLKKSNRLLAVSKKSPTEHNGVENLKKFSGRFKYPEDFKRTRNIGSWGYDLLSTFIN